MTTSEILNRSKESMIPETAIIVNRIGHSYYLERRDIIGGKMTVGVPLTKDCIKDIVDSFSSDRKDIVHGVIPDNMLYADCRPGHEKYVWFQKPCKKHVYFKDNLNIPNGEMCVPGLVYVVRNNSLSMYAFIGIRPKDKLFRAPFFNIYEGGGVCLGNAKVRKPDTLTYEAVIQYWEQMFWKSEFASLIGGNTVNGNLSTLTKRLIETGEKFPTSELLPVKTKLKNLI